MGVLNEACLEFDSLTEKLANCDPEDLGLDQRGGGEEGNPQQKLLVAEVCRRNS